MILRVFGNVITDISKTLKYVYYFCFSEATSSFNHHDNRDIYYIILCSILDHEKDEVEYQQIPLL